MVNRRKVFLEAMILNPDFKTCMDDGNCVEASLVNKKSMKH